MIGLMLTAVVIWGLGFLLPGTPPSPTRTWEQRVALMFFEGSLMLYIAVLLLSLLQLQGEWIAWLAAPVILVSMVKFWGRRGASLRMPSKLEDCSWGDGVALLALLVYSTCTFLLWNVHPDFIYHWGLKGWKFYAAGGIDFNFLSRPWNSGHLHPEYPNLLATLFGFSALLDGQFSLPAVVSWSSMIFLVTLISARGIIRQGYEWTWLSKVALAFISLCCCMFGVGYLQAGGADWLMACAVVAGVGALLRREAGPALDREVGVIAAFAAASKMEGMPLGLALIGVHLWRRLSSFEMLRAKSTLAATLGPMAVVLGLQQLAIRYFGLVSGPRTFVSPFEGLDRWVVIGTELMASFRITTWHGMAFCLFLVPGLLLMKRFRFASALLGVQLAFYIFIYLTSPDPEPMIRNSAPRLWFHLAPAAWLMTFLAIDQLARQTQPSSTEDLKS